MENEIKLQKDKRCCVYLEEDLLRKTKAFANAQCGGNVSEFIREIIYATLYRKESKNASANLKDFPKDCFLRFRVSETEYQSLKNQAKARGISVSKFIRGCALYRKKSFVKIDAPLLRQLYFELNKELCNIEQLKRLCEKYNGSQQELDLYNALIVDYKNMLTRLAALIQLAKEGSWEEL